MKKTQIALTNFLIINKNLKRTFINNNSKKKVIKKIDKIFDNKLNEYEKYKANEYILLKTEKKKYDYLYCAEIGRLDKKQSIFDFDTLYDWDKDWWQFQKDSIDKTYKNKSSKNYKWYNQNYKTYKNIYAQGEWFRWIEENDYNRNNKLVYGAITGLYGYIISEISEWIDSRIEEIYPNFLYKDHRKPTFQKEKGTKYSTMISFETRACGFEKELESLKKLYKENFYKIEKIIEDSIKIYKEYTFTNTIYHHSSKEKIEDHLKYMIIGGISSAKKIRFKHFLDDFYEKEQPYGIIENLLKNLKNVIEKKYIKTWVKMVKNDEN